MSINFFTTANKEYEHFVLPYIFSVLHNVPNSHVEIAVDDVMAFVLSYNKQLKILKSVGYTDYHICKKDDFTGKEIVENTKRFLMEPQIKADIYYIGDIDIFIFDNCVEQFHKLQMLRNKCCYSNIVRFGTNRLTGLHACIDEWYVVTSLLRDTIITDSGNDEKTLYSLAWNSIGLPDRYTSNNTRPVHGLHLSPNRTIDSSPGWNVKQYGKKMAELTKTGLWKFVSRTFDKKYLDLIDKVVEWSEK